MSKLLATLAAASVVTIAAAAEALPVSISFGTTGAQTTSNPSPTPSGEPSNNDGLMLPGQVGDWSQLIVGAGNTAVTSPLERSIMVDDILFTLNVGGANNTRTFWPGSGDPLRSSVIFVSTNPLAPGNTELTWRLSGLVDGAKYDLILFGQEVSGGVANPGAFSINGFNGGDPIGLDSENDANFLGVTATGGEISGLLALQPDTAFGAWSGIQFQQSVSAVPLPAPILLLLSGFGMLFCFKRRAA